MKNILALVITLALCALGWYVSLTPDYMAWLNSHWYVYLALVPVMNFLVKLTSWRGDDSAWDYIKKELLSKH